MLFYFIPVTILSTPLGQFLGDKLSTKVVALSGGLLITCVAVFELYRNRDGIMHYIVNLSDERRGSEVREVPGQFYNLGLSTHEDALGRTNFNENNSVHDMFGLTEMSVSKVQCLSLRIILYNTCQCIHT